MFFYAGSAFFKSSQVSKKLHGNFVWFVHVFSLSKTKVCLDKKIQLLDRLEFLYFNGSNKKYLK